MQATWNWIHAKRINAQKTKAREHVKRQRVMLICRVLQAGGKAQTLWCWSQSSIHNSHDHGSGLSKEGCCNWKVRMFECLSVWNVLGFELLNVENKIKKISYLICWIRTCLMLRLKGTHFDWQCCDLGRDEPSSIRCLNWLVPSWIAGEVFSRCPWVYRAFRFQCTCALQNETQMDR